MNTKAAAIISVKVLAIFTFVKFVAYLGSIYSIIDFAINQSDYGSVGIRLVSIISPIILVLVVSIVLWLYADRLSDQMVKNLLITEDAKISFEHLQTVAFSVVGLCLAVNALPNLIQSIISLKVMESEHMMQSTNMKITQLLGPGLKFLIGFWLLLGSQGIVGLLKKLKTLGLNNEV